MKTRIAVFLSSRSDIPAAYLPAAREVGEWIGRTGRTLVYGGARRGQMEVLAQAVRQSGGRVVGVVPDILVQRHLESDAVQVAFYTAGLDDRKATMLRESDVIVALPGGIGTLDEVFTALAENTIGTANHQIILYNAGGCWDAMLAMLRQMVSDHLADAEVVERIAIATTTDDLERLCQYPPLKPLSVMSEPLRIIISGGGTGGHIFPAVSIANALRQLRPDADILFVGAEGRMEMQRVPEAGYTIKGLPVAGFDRRRLWRNIGVLIKLMKSRRMARRIIKDFRPQVAVGVGGYASGPTLNMAQKMGIPTLIQEQNSYAGVTNKLLAKRADAICTAYDGMERFFPADRITLTGNPVRQNLLNNPMPHAEALKALGLDATRRTVLIVGGSLGARTLNESILGHLDVIAAQQDVQFVWQTGKYYDAEITARLSEAGCPPNLKATPFISDMATAYAAADLVISRAGAGSISEFCLLGKPVILVPSPNVAEDHQTQNAMALVRKEAAICVRDAEARDALLDTALQTVRDDSRLKSLAQHIHLLAKPHAAREIAEKVIALAEGK